MRIDDHALLSDCRSAALVDRRGTIDWWCAPRFDSPATFARLLDADAGHWTITMPGDTEREYIDEGPILRTTFRSTSGEATLTDALALARGARGHEITGGPVTQVVRRAECTRGEIELEIDLAPRPEFGLTRPHLVRTDEGWELSSGSARLNLRSSVEHRADGDRLRASVRLREGEAAEWLLAAGKPDGRRAVAMLEDTQAGWRSWAEKHPTLDGPYGAQMRRSAMVLQALTYAPSGVVVAAPTTSLPERMGDTWNWDYRYAWLRDLSFVVRALWVAACPDEPARYFDWIARALGQLDGEHVQIMFGVEGERDLTEHTLDHLAGFRDSRPVRVGNDAWNQSQLDVPGEVIDAAHLMRDYLGERISSPVRETLISLADHAAARWKEPDYGMWEARDQARHYLSSKVMCWVALDRAVQLASALGANARAGAWRTARDEARAEILEKGWNEEVRAFTGAFGSDMLDASVLLMPLVEFLPASDPRFRATVERIEERLANERGVQRWQDEGSAFVLCGFWLAECLWLMGDHERARERFDATVASTNDLGLMAEEVDLRTGEPLGNFPQALSHVGLINAAWRLSGSGDPA